MVFKIAVSGKGGTGKTTVSSLIIRSLVKMGKLPVLAVDADPNSNLNISIGLDYEKTIADIRENIEDKDVPEGMTKISYVALKIEEVLSEGKGIDMLVMGRPEGVGCYCAANHFLRDYLSRLSGRYKYVVMDNEAGLEHLSRRTTDNVDALLIVSEPTMVSVQSAIRVKETAEQLKLKIKKMYHVFNKLDGKETGGIKRLEEKLQKHGLNMLVNIPRDNALVKASEEGKDLLSLDEETPAIKAVDDLLKRITGL